MRRYTWVAGLLVGLALSGPALAQRAITFGPVLVGPTQNKVISTVDPNLPIAQPMTVQQGGLSKLTNLFHRPSQIGKPVHGSSNFPKPGDLPGMDYLSNFKMYRGQPTK
jgi:hypothetical protein